MRRRLLVSRGRFRRYVRRAVQALPPHFRAAAQNIVVVVESLPQAADFAGGDGDAAEPADTLFGVYRGVPLPQRSADHSMATPDVIAVFRRPLLAACRSRRMLREEIRLTILHEMGHFFGLEEPAVEHL